MHYLDNLPQHRQLQGQPLAAVPPVPMPRSSTSNRVAACTIARCSSACRRSSRTLARPVTHDDIDDAAAVFAAHGEPFNETGWRDIVDRLGGHPPVRIRAVPEGCVVPTHQALMTIESTDPAAFWCRRTWKRCCCAWYPVTVATISWHARQTIAAFLQQTSDDPQGSCRSSCTTSARAVYRAWNRPRWAVPRTWSTSSAPIPYRPCARPARTITRRWPVIRFPPPSTAPSPAGARA